MLLFPPFHYVATVQVVNLGYSFILTPPDYGLGRVASVNIVMLLTQWVGVGLVGAIAFRLLRD
jgi:hypothetical protein